MFEEEIKVEKLPIKDFDNKTFVILQSNTNTYTHGFFKYPCRFIPEIPRWAINTYTKENDIVFDPFAGSGTSLLESIINNRKAYGTEIDDIAKLIIKAKSLILSKNEFYELKETWGTLNDSVLKNDYPEDIPDMNNLEHWFSERNIHQLGKITHFIKQINNQNIQCFFNICLASIIKKVSYCDDISPKPYVSSRIKKKENEALVEFNNIFNKYLVMLEDFNELNPRHNIDLVDGDALNFTFDDKIDLAITSPPYINAFDYVRTMRLENLWVGTKNEAELRSSKCLYVGTEQIKMNVEEKNLSILNDSELLKECYDSIFVKDKKRALIVKKFFEDMKINLKTIYKNLSINGHYVIVIGNSTIRNVKIESWNILKDIAVKVGFRCEAVFRYLIRNPYIRIPRNGHGGIVNYDYVLCLKKEI